MHLNVELIITESCNLKCTYCYMNNQPKVMDTQTFDLFLDSIGEILSLYSLEKYHLSFFGGEPLANWKLISYALPLLKADQRCASMNVISNGLLLDEEKLGILKEYDVGFSLSFDGLWTNETRPLATKKDTLAEYMSKREILTRHFSYAKTMVSPSIVKSLVDNHKFLVDYGFSFPDFSIVRDDIWNKESIDAFDVSIKELADHVIERVKGGSYEFNGIFSLYLSDLMAGNKYGKRKFGCFAGVNGIGYTPEGIYYPCARFATNREKDIYDAKNKTFNETTLSIFKKEKCIDPSSYEKCIGCSLYKYCNTGCTHSQMKTDADGNIFQEPIDSICELFHSCYRQSMRIYNELSGNSLFNEMLKKEINIWNLLPN